MPTGELEESSLKRELLHCLGKKNLVSDDEGSSPSWLTNCVELVLERPNTRRRYLAGEDDVQVKPNAASADETSFHQRRELSAKKKHKKKTKAERERQTVIAIAATAVATFMIVSVLFCCWLCLRNNEADKFAAANKDEKPLLHLRDSLASKHLFCPSLSASLASVSTKDQSLGSNLSMQHEAQAVEGQSSETIPNSGDVMPALKPPPGRPVPAPPPPPPGAAPPPPPKPRAPPAPPPKGRPAPPDKVMASPNQSMVWHEISGGSFQFDEEMIESLFGYTNANKNTNERRRELVDNAVQYIQIIDPRKAQNLNILLKALNVTTEEVLDALREANELPVELLSTLLKMAPTSDEELKLRLYAGELAQLGPAERFLKAVVEVPFAFKRIESLLFMSCLQEEVTTLKEAFKTLEIACNKLKNSRLFLKLLEAVLKTGNRMNVGTYRGGAMAFKLDTLLKLADVKGADGIRAVRTARADASVSSVVSVDLKDDSHDPLAEEHYCNLGLQVVSSLSSDFEAVRKAAVLEPEMLSSSLSKLRVSLTKAKGFVQSDMKSDEESEFYCSLVAFMDRADSDISWLTEEEKRIQALMKTTADYFHGNSGKEEGLRLFTIVRSFLTMLDKACKEVKEDRAKKQQQAPKASPLKKDHPGELSSKSTASQQQQQPENLNQKRLFPAIAERRNGSSSSDDDDSSDDD
ncbi:Formin-like protein 3 [Linum perenne]